MRKKEERSKQGQTNNKAKQHSTPKAVTFPKKNELPLVGLKPTTLYTLGRALYLYMYVCVDIITAVSAADHVQVGGIPEDMEQMKFKEVEKRFLKQFQMPSEEKLVNCE